MASPELASLDQTLNELREYLIAKHDDLGTYDRRDHQLATAFILLASAAIEDYVEARCRSVATSSINRIKRSRPTRAGHALAVWYCLKKGNQAIPLTLDEVSAGDHDFLDKVEDTYVRLTNRTHGIDSDDLKSLIIPLGLREDDFDQQLMDRLDALSDARNRASHKRVNRAKTMSPPQTEWSDKVGPILKLLTVFDEMLDLVEKQYE